ncbi:MAG: PAS domain S-box protein [Deltaproteobacteria bacterium]|nr:PAS domain S-box protein [Deltaproteobacteria bacterium]
MASDDSGREAPLGANEALFRAVIDHASDALFVHGPDGRVIDVNDAACRSLGYTRHELLGMMPGDFDAKMTADDLAALSTRLEAGDVVSIDSRHRRKDGSTFPVEVRIQRFAHDGTFRSVSLARDMTHRELAAKQLRESEERFRELAETISDVFWIVDPHKHEILYISPAYEKIWGRPTATAYASPRSWLDAVHEEDRERVREAAETRHESAYSAEYRIVRPDGTIRWIHDCAYPVKGPTGIERIVGVARDITEQRVLEERLLHAQKMDAIGRLAGGIAHDFNNIIGAITMEADLALELEPPPELSESLHDIRTAANRGAALTRQLLMFSRRQVMRVQTLDLNTHVMNLARMLQRIIGEDIGLQLHLSPTPLVVRADAGMLDQVIMNLAVNARDAMPEGGTLRIETAVRTVPTSRLPMEAPPGRYACLRVCDNGTGIPPEIVPRIFEPFYTTKQSGEGTGLGLATVFGVVQQHDGWVTVDSQLEHGTTFEVCLPLLDEVTTTAEQTGPHARGTGETILLVEDEAPFRRATRRLLERHGYRVVDAENGLEALRLWHATEPEVALVVTDLVMPGGISGQDLAERLRAERPDAKFVFTSGYSTQRGGIVSADNFVQKPFASGQLLETIRRTLDR